MAPFLMARDEFAESWRNLPQHRFVLFPAKEAGGGNMFRNFIKILDTG